MSFFKKNAVSKPNCPKCGLYKQCKSPRMKYTGEGKKKILLIAEAPGRDEDIKGVQLIGKAGQRLRKELRLLNINIDKDCWKINAVNCRPIDPDGGNATPTVQQIDCCRPYMEGIIKRLKPEKIIILGNIALKSFYTGRPNKGIGIATGLKFWDSKYNSWVYPIWHPSYIERHSYNELLAAEFVRCLKRAVNNDPAPLHKQWNKIHAISNFKQAIEALTDCLRHDKTIAIDYETTGLDMYKEGHRTASFAWANHKGSWAVPVEHPCFTIKQQDKIVVVIRRILKKRKIKKIVHNISFEYQWTKAVFKVEPRNFFWCTQLAEHVLDNRKNVGKLKFQAFRRWGIEDYDTLSKKYIKTNPATGFNDMLKMPLDALLKYNAYDTLYTFELYRDQLTEFVGKELEAYTFFHKGALALCEMSYNGITIKKSFYLRQKDILEKERNELIKEVMSIEEVKLFKRKYNSFNYDSPKDMQKILFGLMKLKPIKETKTGYSVDSDVLTKLNIPLTNNIIKIRKLNKMIGTYIDGFLKLVQQDRLHPGFSLNFARSFRSSSSNPNFQNVPKRDPKAKKVVRSGMVPRKGRVLGEADFAGAEISTSCYYHKDPTFYKYQTEGGGDMHRDACAEILKIGRDEVPGEARQATKGIWTFSQFFGSYYGSCAKQGWEEYPLLVDDDGNPIQIRGMDIGDWMIKTFKTYRVFENHLKDFEDKFWNDWFKVYTKWKEKIVKQYKKDGYIETFMGFRFKGYMDRKQCTNYPIQGTSFHLLLHSAYTFWRECRLRGLDTLIIGQIHDSLILDIPVEEIDEVRDLLVDIVSNLHKTFTWMDFPMGLDFEISKSYELGGSFAKMEKVQL